MPDNKIRKRCNPGKGRRGFDIHSEIEDTQKKAMHDTVRVSVNILRSLYYHALLACRDGDYANPTQYISDLIRRDKHVKNLKPPSLDPPLHEPTTVEPEK